MSYNIADLVEENNRLQELNANNFSEKMRLLRENNKLREALKPFADKAKRYVDFADDVDMYVRVGELRSAADAYNETDDVWDACRGIAPAATGEMSSEEFIRKERDEW